jgi:hypothetical protein
LWIAHGVCPSALSAVRPSRGLWIAHDVCPNALSPRVKGFIHAQSWYVDFSPVSVE